mmetsp:Transcript_12970/g.21937  ORF Transcript_12970/g.21937 Transcript_12970/m.21937 type:complete len:167 (-) Transcript_12970:64-564(-)|eukprot:CAMPEP_0168616330 /NCGR_PEP_ID=MMETSP0449_2-20121227/4972_1 /TAXON_ID=1082188 /ORGANISM="Strombidium rassoulzadegani, Strain ras09" /LENGTH=166 /DNA_ID=CAMNT_0008657113 /DNA_START=97 /DNA_END=597 /DNA_ORIENTATION=+
MADFLSNDEGEILANVQDCMGFKSQFDSKGLEELRSRLVRRMEMVHNRYDPTTHLFQKVYYHPGLLLQDERELRRIFETHNAAQERNKSMIQFASFIAFWPSFYFASQRLRPTSALLFAAGYVTFYNSFVNPISYELLQRSLNKDARRMADKYGVSADESKYYKSD